MARKVSGLVAGLLALTTFFPQGAVAERRGPVVYSSAYQSADAIWLRKEAGDTYMYFAGAVHTTSATTQKSRTLAWADRSKCAVAKTKHSTAIACSGFSRSTRIHPDNFEFDPLMESAHLDFGKAHISWKAQEEPDPSLWHFADPSFGALAWASVDRWSKASGEVLGTKMTGRHWTDMGFMSEGAYALVWLVTPTGRYWVDPDTGRVHYKFRFEIPR